MGWVREGRQAPGPGSSWKQAAGQTTASSAEAAGLTCSGEAAAAASHHYQPAAPPRTCDVDIVGARTHCCIHDRCAQQRKGACGGQHHPRLGCNRVQRGLLLVGGRAMGAGLFGSVGIKPANSAGGGAAALSHMHRHAALPSQPHHTPAKREGGASNHNPASQAGRLSGEGRAHLVAQVSHQDGHIPDLPAVLLAQLQAQLLQPLLAAVRKCRRV